MSPRTRVSSRTVLAALALLGAGAGVPRPCGACPVVNRYPFGTVDAEASQSGGSFPDGIRAADDFFLPLGNGAGYNVRVIKVVMIANYALTPANVGITVYADSTSAGPISPHPGAVVSGPPNAAPTVRDLGPGFLAGYRLYEVSYALAPGMLRLAPNQWYWLSPFALAGSPTGAAYVTLSAAPGVVRQPILTSDGTPSGTFTTWTSTVVCCLGGAHDFAMYIDAAQIGRPIADVNCSLGLSVQDIFDFLIGYFGGGPGGDFNGVGGTTVQDIFDFLAAYFAG